MLDVAGEGPSLNFIEAMEQEHTQQSDSLLPFTTSNYGLTTWPAQVRLPPILNPTPLPSVTPTHIAASPMLLP
jgi:hypothetical protein